MIAKIQIKAFVTAISIIMLFITFFSNYFFFQADLIESFIRGVITYIFSYIVMNVVFFIWRITYSTSEWKIIAKDLPIENIGETEEIEELA